MMALLARFFGGLLSRILLVALALTATQFPVYYAQYLQTLAGARMEATLRYEELRREAAALHLEVEAFIARHEQNSDEVFQVSGRIHRTTLSRYQSLTTAWETLSAAQIIEKPVVLFKHFDQQIADATVFRPGVPLNVEAGAYALLGILLAWLFSALLGALFMPRPRSALGS